MSPFAQRVYSATRVAFGDVPGARIRTVEGAGGAVSITAYEEVRARGTFYVTGTISRYSELTLEKWARFLRERRDGELGGAGVIPAHLRPSRRR